MAVGGTGFAYNGAATVAVTDCDFDEDDAEEEENSSCRVQGRRHPKVRCAVGNPGRRCYPKGVLFETASKHITLRWMYKNYGMTGNQTNHQRATSHGMRTYGAGHIEFRFHQVVEILVPSHAGDAWTAKYRFRFCCDRSIVVEVVEGVNVDFFTEATFPARHVMRREKIQGRHHAC